MTTCMHAKVHEEFFFFYATCRSAISWEVPVLNQCTSDKKMLILVTLVCSPHVYSPWFQSIIPDLGKQMISGIIENGLTEIISMKKMLLGTWIKFLGFLRDDATSMF